MKNKPYIFVLIGFLCFISFSLSAEERDNVEVIDTICTWQNEIQSPESFSFDSKTYDKFKNDKNFNYYESRIKGKSFIERIREFLERWFRENIGYNLSRKEVDTALWIIGILFVIVTVFIIYRFNRGLFYQNKKRPISYSVDEESIHGQNFDSLIKESLQKNNYNDAIRWQYMKVLKNLNEKEIISWDPYKTVNEYVYEIKDLELRKQFRDLSLLFAYFRYGNGISDLSDYQEVQVLSNSIIGKDEV